VSLLGVRSRASILVMANAALDISRLTAEERLELLDELWASLGRDPHALPLDEGQKSELEERLRDLQVEGPTGFTWDEVVAQARSQRR
jgi:putative addiction module component (TIGR02574 family)